MNGWLLDTNIASELSKDPPDAACLAWLRARQSECFISAITLAELSFGIERREDGRRKRELERDLAFLLEDYEGRFFEFDGNAAREWGRYAAALEADFGSKWYEQFDLRDTMIAAIAREYALTVVTRNTKDFPFCDVENPFKSPQPPTPDSEKSKRFKSVTLEVMRDMPNASPEEIDKEINRRYDALEFPEA